MIRKRNGKTSPNRRLTYRSFTSRVLFPGITMDAFTLGVSRVHLYFVLKGIRDSKPLMRRYRALKKEHGPIKEIAK